MKTENRKGKKLHFGTFFLHISILFTNFAPKMNVFVKTFPNCKINLGLTITGKRADGYHNLETVFVPLPSFCDELEVTPLAASAEGTSTTPYILLEEGIVVDCPPEKNLIIRTYMALRERFPEKVLPVRIRFRKNIPFGAGLGGGSADAAFMAKTVNQLFDLQLTDDELEAVVAPLGADCAFFIRNTPRFAEGIGNEFSAVPETLVKELNGRWIVLIKPDCAVSTAVAYRGVLAAKEGQSEGMPLREAIGLPVKDWQSHIFNDFEHTIFPAYPEIANAKKALLERNALYAAMSGSGATVFGLFDHEPDLTGLDHVIYSSLLDLVQL